MAVRRKKLGAWVDDSRPGVRGFGRLGRCNPGAPGCPKGPTGAFCEEWTLSLNRNEKAAVVADVSAQAARAQTLALAEYRGLTVEHLNKPAQGRAREGCVSSRAEEHTGSSRRQWHAVRGGVGRHGRPADLRLFLKTLLPPRKSLPTSPRATTSWLSKVVPTRARCWMPTGSRPWQPSPAAKC